MKKIEITDSKYILDTTTKFNKQLRKVIKQGKDINKLITIIKIIANNELLPAKYNDHLLTDSKNYTDCRECHIEPDWLLVYKIKNDTLVLLLFATGSHSELF